MLFLQERLVILSLCTALTDLRRRIELGQPEPQLCSLPQGLLPARSSSHSLGRGMKPTSNVSEGEGYTQQCKGRQEDGHPSAGKVWLPCELASNLVLSDLASDTHGLDLPASLAPLLNHTCLFWWSVPLLTSPAKAFLVALVGDGKSCKSEG